MTKPFGAMELVARVDALTRRPRLAKPRADAAPVDRFGDVEVHRASRIVERAREPVALSPKEYDLLLALMNRDGAVTTRNELLTEVSGVPIRCEHTDGGHSCRSSARSSRRNRRSRNTFSPYAKTGYRFEP